MAINTTSFLNTPQAGDDFFTSATTGLTEDSLCITYLAVMANDLGGAAKSLYSLDNGTNSIGVLSPTDLLTQDTVRTEALTADTSAQGAKIWITTDGKVGYDASALKTQLQHLSAGEFLTDTFTYAIRLGNGTLSWATATVQIAGVNDAPVVTAVTGTAVEDHASITLDALANASDVDNGATLSVTNLPSSLPPGVTYNASTHSFTLDPSNAAFQHLAAGIHTTVTVNYGVTDGSATTAASVSWEVTGTNDAPVATAKTDVATEGGTTIGGHVMATDLDDGQTATLVYSATSAVPAGLTFNVDGSYTFDPTVGAYDHLKAGASQDVVVSYKANDGAADSNVQTLTITVTGTNDAPVAAAKTDVATEGGTTISGHVMATDLDDGQTATLVYSATSAVPSGLTFNANGSYTFDPTVGAYDHLKAGATQDVVVSYKANDGTADSNISTLTITVMGTNDAPVVSGEVMASATEDQAKVALNALANAADVDDGTTLSVTNLPDSLPSGVSYDAATHSFTLDPSNAAFRHLATGDHTTVTVDYGVTDGTAATAASVSWNVTGTNDAPVAAAKAGVAIEGGATTSGNVVAADVDDGATLTYSLTSGPAPAGLSFNANGSYSFDPKVGAYDHLKAGATQDVVVSYKATDGTVDSNVQTLTITVTGTNDAPVVTGAMTGTAAEDASGVTLNALANASDVDDARALSVTNLPGTLPPGVTYNALTHSFTLDPSNAVFQHLAAGDHSTVTVNYGVTDGIATTAASVSWNVTGTNDVPVITSNGGCATTDLSVDENSTAVTAVTATDADDGATQTYLIVGGADAARFTIDVATGTLSFVSAPNSEAPTDSNSDGVYNVTVRAFDGVSFEDQAVAVTVNDVNEFAVATPVDTNAALNAVNENSAIGTVVGVTAHASDADATNSGVTYSLSSNPGGLFAIDATTGVVTTAAAIDRESLGASASITVLATSADGSMSNQHFTIAINDVNEFAVTTPVDTSAAANAIDENVAMGSLVGITASAGDADATNSGVTYSLSSNPGGLFAIDATTGVVTTAGAIDRESLGANTSITVLATSADGSTANQAFTIVINDVNEFAVTAPVDTNAAANAVNENVAIGTLVGIAASASDADATNNGVTYSLSSNPGGLFAIDTTTGVVTTTAVIDRESLGASASITVLATSADGSTANQVFAIGINDVNEFAVTTSVDSNAAANAVNENVAMGSQVGITASASDADATNNGVTYTLSSNPGGLFAIDATTGVVTTAAAIDRESVGASASITVLATSADGSTANQAFSIAINDVNEFAVTTPVDTNAAANAIDENVAIGALVGITASAGDADATNNGVTYTLSSNPGGLFAIDATTGVVTTAAAIDRESLGGSVTIEVSATSADTSTAAQSFTVAINDVNEFAVATPVDTSAAANAIDENVAMGSLVGITASAGDADATNNGVTYSLSSNPGGLFAIDATTGVVTTAAVIDRESLGGSVTIEVSATSADTSTAARSFTVAINDVNEFAVTTPVDTNAAANAVNENVAIGTLVGIAASASDADATNNGLTYSLTDNAGGKFAIDATTGVVTVAGAIDREVDASLNVTVRATGQDGSTADQVFTIVVNDVNEFDVTTPVDTNAAANAVNENVAIGTLVGITASAGDADATNNGVTYSLTDSAGDKFAIDATTGVVTVAGAIDRESIGASASITVLATSADGSTANQAFSIAINDVNEFAVTTPVDTNAAANAVNENATIGTLVGITASASDADATNNGVTYSLTDNAGGKFAIDETTGVVTVAGAIDREVDASLNVIVRAAGQDGSTADQVFTIVVNDVNEFAVTTPVDTSAAANAVNENVAIGTLVGITASAGDADATNNGVTYSLTDNAGGKFAIDSATGVVTVAGAIDRESIGASASITVLATSADGSTANQAFTIAINDVNEFAVTGPADTDATPNAVNENSIIGTVVGVTAHASDADATNNGVSYSLTDNAGGRFAIDATTGVVTVAGAIDRESLGGSVTIEVTATSADASTAAQSFTIAINDVNEFAVTTPVDTSAAANAVNENVAIGTLVGITASAGDADATNNGVSYSLTDNAGGRFVIDATTGVVTVAGAIDREVDASLNVTVRATDQDGSTADQVFTIAVNDVNEFAVTTPVDTNAALNAVNENSAIGTAVGVTAHANDADATNNGVSYSLTDNAGGRFAIDATTGVVTVAGAIDRESIGASASITVLATSADGSTANRDFTIAINDVNEFAVTAPVDTSAAANAIDENVAIGSLVGITASSSDADATNNGVTYSLTDNAGGKFAIDSATGVVTVAGAIDRESTGASASITVRATSADGSTANQAFTIAINDVNEFTVTAPADTNAAANAVNENAAIGSLVGITASAGDADATNNGVTYTLSSNSGGLFAINATTGVVTTASAIDRESIGGSASITVLATSADGSTANQAFTIAINDVNEFAVTAPADTNAAANAVNENVAIGTLVGITAFASDADATNDNVTYSLSGNPGGLFAINATTGVVTTAAAIDRESLGGSVTIEVTATSADASMAAQNFTIAINDINEAPTVTSAASGIAPENVATSTAVYSVTATDPDAGTTLSYAITGADAALFNVDSSTGAVTFKASPNFEAPADSGANNVYDIVVHANDGTNDTTKAVAITVTNVNEAPTITSTTSASAPENVATSTAAYTVAATDPDAGATLSYAITGTDAALFNVNSSTGAVTFKASPNFEAPADSGANNAYDIVVHANDGTNDTTKAVAIAVTNASETPATSISGIDISADSGSSSTDFTTNVAAQTITGTLSAGLVAGESLLGSVDGGAHWIDISNKVSGNSINWDGATLAGSNTIQIKVANTDGNNGLAASQAYVLDTSTPAAAAIAVVTDDVPPVAGTVANNGFTNDTTPTLTGTVEANSTVTVMDGATTLGTATASGAGAWSFTTAVLSQATHSFTATATDAAGNVSAPSTAYAVTIDTAAPPAPTITAVTDDVSPVTGTVANNGFTNDTTPTLAGTAEANSTVAVMDGATTLGTATANGAGAWSFTTAALGQATHTFTATATDSAGNLSAASVAYAVTVDTAAPIAPSITGVNDDVAPVTGTVANNGFTNDTTPTLTGTAEANSVVTVKDGATTLGSATANGAGAWSFTPAALSQATHSFTATATDAAGNVSAASTAYAVTIDTAAPSAPTITAVADDVAPVTGAVANNGFTNDADLAVKVSLGGTGAVAGDTVQLYNGSGTGSQLGSSYTLTSTDISSGFANVQTGTLSNGSTYTLTARITDAAGNQSAVSTNSWTVTEDTTAPTVSSVVATGAGITGGDGDLNAGHVVTLTVNTSEAVTVVGGTPTLTLNDGGTATYQSGSGSGALVFTYTVTAGRNTNDLTVTAFNANSATIADVAGNAANLAGAVTNPPGTLQIDTTADSGTPLTLSGSAVKSGSSITSATVTLSGIDSDIVLGGTITLTDAHVHTVTHTITAADIAAEKAAGGVLTVTTWDTSLNALNKNDTLTPHASVTDTVGNVALANGSGFSAPPAGVAGEPINLALSDPSADPSDQLTVSITGVPVNWTLNAGTKSGDGTWTAQTTNPSVLSITTTADFVGAMVLDVAMTWTNADGTTGTRTVADNVEAYAPGSPIFALSADDNLTASSAADLLVFAQPIAQDVIHNFDATADKIDLIAFTGVSGFNNLSITDDASGNAVIATGGGSTITVVGVDAANLTAANFEFNVEPVTINTGTMTIANGAILPLGGVIDNSGTIALGSAGSETDLQILVESVTLQGGGHVVLSDDSNNVIFGGSSNATLINVDNTISGAGQLGAGQMALVNAGTIIADGSHALVVDTGGSAVANSGILEASGSGGLVVDGAVNGAGSLWANGGAVTIHGDVTGHGSASIDGSGVLEFGAASDANVGFAGNASGTLTIDHAAAFTGTVAGLNADDTLHFGDIAFCASTLVNYTANAAGTAGSLVVSDGANTAQMTLIGQYSATDFRLAADQGGSTAILNTASANGTVLGTAGADVLVGTDGNDIIVGGAGRDTLTGGAGHDTFLFRGSDAGAVDTITDFDAGAGGDVLNVGLLLQGCSSDADLAQFISLRQIGDDTIVSIDCDGAGSAHVFQDLLLLQGVTGLDFSTLIAHVDATPLH